MFATSANSTMRLTAGLLWRPMRPSARMAGENTATRQRQSQSPQGRRVSRASTRDHHKPRAQVTKPDLHISAVRGFLDPPRTWIPLSPSRLERRRWLAWTTVCALDTTSTISTRSSHRGTTGDRRHHLLPDPSGGEAQRSDIQCVGTGQAHRDLQDQARDRDPLPRAARRSAALHAGGTRTQKRAGSPSRGALEAVARSHPRPGGTSMVPPFLLYRGAQVWRLPQPTVCRGSRPATSIHDRAYQHSSRQHRGGDHLKIGERARARQDGSSF